MSVAKRRSPKAVFVLGLGHIGASLAARLSRRGYQVWGWDADFGAIRHCERKKWILRQIRPPRTGVCVVALPETCVDDERVLAMILGLPRGWVVTDAFSSKGQATLELATFCRAHGIGFAWSHPLAGREGQGAKSADETIFDGATVLLDSAAPEAVRKAVAAIWVAAGCRSKTMSTAAHQRAMGAGSHLMHALAFALSTVAARNGIASPSILGATRVAKSSPEAWATILASNGVETTRALAQLQRELATVAKLIGTPRGKKLVAYLKTARAARLRLE